MPYWPPDWELFFIVVAFIAASLAVRGWRDLLVMVLVAAAVTFPIKWIGPVLGLPFLGEDAVTYVRDGDQWKLNGRFSPAMIAAIILASLAMLAAKGPFAGRR